MNPILISNVPIPKESVKFLEGKYPDLEVKEYCEDLIFSSSDQIIINVDESTEKEILSKIKATNSRCKFIWQIQSELVPNDYSYTLLQKYIGNRDFNTVLSILKNGKKLCLIYGNCQITVISRLLSSSKDFSEKYVLIQMPEVFKVDEYATKYSNMITAYENADCFIHQFVKKDNRFGPKLATDNILRYFREDCLKVCIPNSYVGFYFPQLTKIKGEKVPNNMLLPYGDCNIQKNTICNTYPELINKLESEELYGEEEVLEYFDKCIKELIEREKNCNVLISDYILERYQTTCLGYSPNHPINAVLEEVSKRILNSMGCEVTDLDSELALDQYEMIIYPSVAKHLGLKFNKTKFIINRKITPKPLTISEYAAYYTYYTQPTLFYGRLQNPYISPALSLSINISLIENKIIIANNHMIHLNISFKVRENGKIMIHLPRKCCPRYSFNGVCITKEKNYCFTLNSDGHIVLPIEKTNWAIIDCTYMVI